MSERPCECPRRFVVVSVLGTRFQTPVLKRNINPIYPAKDATFDFPIYLSLADKLGVVELVVWDKDMLKKDYMGEVALPLEDWFANNRPYGFDEPGNTVCQSFAYRTRMSSHNHSGILIKPCFDTRWNESRRVRAS